MILKFLSTVLTFLVLVTNVESQECNDAFTAYIVLDGSKSIESANFVLVKNAVKDFTARAILRNSANRIGIVVFSDDVTNNIKASSNISALVKEIDDIQYPQSGTATDLGISFASGELQKDESFNRRVMIVITDGNSNDLDKTFEVAKKAKDDGITIIAVGIDEVIKMLVPLYESFEKELLNIASYNSLVYRTGFFRDLSTPLNEALQHLCQHLVSIVSPLEDLTIISGTNAILRVMLTDPDVTNVVWKRYGKELNNTAGYNQRIEGRGHTLIRFNTRLEHSGEYSFTVGNATSQCILTVIGRPRNNSVKAGEEAYFQIFVSPAPVAGGKWFKNGQLILFSPSKYAITQQASIRSLSVLNVQDSDEGIYTFTLNNVSTSANLSVQGPTVHGGWSAWSSISSTPCPDCGFDAWKNVTRIRTCTNPAPADGGRNCEGSALRIDRENCNLGLECPVDGSWSEWTAWRSYCDNDTCGQSYVNSAIRTRACNNPPPSGAGLFCRGENYEAITIMCQRVPCPVNGIFGPWSPWTSSACSVTCGGGKRELSRQRRCDSPEPSNGGANCTGDFEETKSEDCNQSSCKVDGRFGPWSPWTSSACSVTCGGGKRELSRQRRCDSPEPSNGGANCTGDFEESKSEDCNQFSCQVDGGWSAWNNISSTPCPDCGSNATKNVTWVRTCTNPAPAEGGRACEGSPLRIDRENCNLLVECPVHGGWSAWNNISSTPCPECGSNATKNVTWVRTCTNPAPAEGGRACEGSPLRIDRENCNLLVECPVHGGWSAWNNISSTPCPDCGSNATKNVTWVRTCTNPAPAEGGRACEGSPLRIDRENCNLLVECPVDGGWSAWNNISSTPCPDCGSNATKNVTWVRTCTNPAPAEGGRACEGSPLRIDRENCNLLVECPVHGGWSAWNNISSTPCPDCGSNATKDVTWARTCTNPAPAEGGRACEGLPLRIDRENCNLLVECPVHGGWSAWNNISSTPCPDCGSNATKNVTWVRTCTNPAPAEGGRACEGSPLRIDRENCNLLVECPVHGGWSAWNNISSTPCPDCGSNATKDVTWVRTCTNPAPAEGGRACEGLPLRIVRENCNLLVECPVNGIFGPWSPWNSSSCSVTCGGGKRELSRQRRCDSPEPSNGGANCTGDFEELKLEDCNQFPCNGLCGDVMEKDDVGYRYHQSDCDKYIQCYSNLDGNVLAVVRTCPVGFYWNQVKFKCQESRRVLCPLESYSSSRMSMKKIPGSCRSYWLKEERAQARCCPLSFSFEEGKGCRPNKDCQDLCPVPFEHKYVCDKRPLSQTRSPSYQLYNSVLGWVNTTCPTGTFFNLVDCGCSELARDTCVSGFSVMFNASTIPDWMSSTGVTLRDGAANFFGFGMINFNISLGAKFNPIKIEFRYKETEINLGSRILLRSNCYDLDDDLSVHVDDDAVNVRVRSENKDVQQFALSTQGIKRSDWKTVTLEYDGHRFVISIESGNVRYSGDLYVYASDFAQCQMIFGSATASSSTNAFSGSLSMISFSQCNLGFTA